MDLGQLYKEWRPLCFSLACHMLGNAADAEDVVQEVFLALQRAPAPEADNWKSYLCRAVHNRCLNRAQSASRKREIYTGPWLPEAIPTDWRSEAGNPEERYLLKESLTTACQLLLQQLSAAERTVFVLREAYRFSFEEIADITGKTTNNCRQIYHRAKRGFGGLLDGLQQFEAKPRVQEQFVEPFLRALISGNVERLIALLSGDAVLYTDGGGKVKAALRPIFGADRIIRFFDGIRSEVPDDLAVEQRELNGGPGVLFRSAGRVFAALTFRFREEAISDLYIVMNPEKLEAFNNR